MQKKTVKIVTSKLASVGQLHQICTMSLPQRFFANFESTCVEKKNLKI